MKASPLFETLEHSVFESQVEDQEDPNLTLLKGFESFDELRSRFMDLTEEEEEIIQLISRNEGLDAKTIGQKNGLSRYRALQKAKGLADRHILRFTTGTKPKSGAKATIYFFLADDISSEVVELMRNSIALAKPGKAVQANPVHRGDSSEAHEQSEGEANRAAQAASKPSPRKSRSSNFWMEPPFSEIVELVNKAPNGIMAKEIEAVTGSRKQTLNGWLRELLAVGQVKRKIAPGTSPREYCYYSATASLESAISPERTEMKSEELELNSIPIIERDFTVSENDEAHHAGQAVAQELLSQQILPELPLTQVEMDIREVLEKLIDQVQDLENRFQSVEQALKGKKTIKSEKIQAFLERA